MGGGGLLPLGSEHTAARPEPVYALYELRVMTVKQAAPGIIPTSVSDLFAQEYIRLVLRQRGPHQQFMRKRSWWSSFAFHMLSNAQENRLHGGFNALLASRV